jgi:hypothetical protein
MVGITQFEQLGCSVDIGGKYDHDTRHRRMVRINLHQNCDKSGIITVNVPYDGIKRSFHRVGTGSSGGKNNYSLSDSFSGWAGEDPMDGSFFNYVQDSEGNMAGSMIDLRNDEVLQFHSQNGFNQVTITASSEFREELEPAYVPDEDEQRKLLSISKRKEFINKHDDINDITLSSLHQVENSTRFFLDDSGGNLDIMVLWTKAAECTVSGLPVGCIVSTVTEANMMSLVNLALFETNMAFQESGVKTKIHLAHAYRHPTYVEDLGDAFTRGMNDLREGNIEGVHANREIYGADIVSLLIQPEDYCGIGFFGPRIDLMYSVIAWDCATGYYSFGHEIGHNLGLEHDRGTLDACSIGGHNYGWRDPKAKFRTVLAYDCRPGQCDNNIDVRCSRIPRFSNPNFTYSGKALGDARNNNVKKINDVRVEVAGYYAHVSVHETSTECNDSPFRFKLVKNKKRFNRDCTWVANKNTKRRCALDGVSSMCPNTCDTCSSCLDGLNRFRLIWKGNRIARDCAWVSNKATIQRCDTMGVADSCRMTCDKC